MARQEHLLSIFVASPGDVAAERESLEAIVKEYNVTWGAELNIRLDLLKWETHSFPGIGEYSQDVINKQISQDYDIFIGVMWHRYGTATGRAGSGTVEEFQLAKERYNNNPNSVKIMFYFKDEPVSPSKLDPDQLAQINEFRKSLGKEGVLYWGFNGLEEFERLIRLHITRRVQEFTHDLKDNKTKDKGQSEEVDKAVSLSLEHNKGDYDGFLDLIRISLERIKESGKIQNRIDQITKEYKQALVVCLEELEVLVAFSSSEGDEIEKTTYIRIIDKFKKHMHQYVVEMETNVPLFGNSFYAGIDSLNQAAKYYLELDPAEIKETRTRRLISAIGGLRLALDNLEVETSHLLTYTKKLPNFPLINEKYYTMKHKATQIQENILDTIRSRRILLVEAENILRNLLKDVVN
ncbi:MAG: DUF4062 domain-containing protein [Thermodesulfobacteriota bacterium]